MLAMIMVADMECGCRFALLDITGAAADLPATMPRCLTLCQLIHTLLPARSRPYASVFAVQVHTLVHTFPTPGLQVMLGSRPSDPALNTSMLAGSVHVDIHQYYVEMSNQQVRTLSHFSHLSHTGLRMLRTGIQVTESHANHGQQECRDGQVHSS